MMYYERRELLFFYCDLMKEQWSMAKPCYTINGNIMCINEREEIMRLMKKWQLLCIDNEGKLWRYDSMKKICEILLLLTFWYYWY